ncbi:WAT1-related protein, partial [Cucurbita argyrosperma subsp. argyrosperma]
MESGVGSSGVGSSGTTICTNGAFHATAKPALLMLLVQSVFAGVNVLYKLAVNDGMNLMIMIAFRFVFASLFMLPLAFFLERMEKLEMRSKEGVAKVAGTLVGIGGAMFLTFYKGIQISIWSTHVDLLRGGHLAHLPQNPHHSHNFVLGSLLALASCLSYSFWLILQTKMTKIYPCQYSSTALMCVMGAIQGLAISICVERDWKQWKLGWNIRLLTVAFAGIVASGAMVTLMAWCVRMRGPLYVSIFSPLMLLLVAIAGSLCLQESLHLG